MSKTPEIFLYEKKITEIFALLSQYSKDAGYSSEEGQRYSHILHEMSGAIGEMHSRIHLAQIAVEKLQAEAAENVSDSSRYFMGRWVQDIIEPRSKAAFDVSEEAQAVVDLFINEGWKPPVREQKF